MNVSDLLSDHSLSFSGLFAVRPLRLAWALSCGLALVSSTWAQPSGATVISGSASVATQVGITTVTAGNNSILKWNSFDLGASQTVEFVQPSAASRVLNWIGGITPSQIDGAIRANGQVYLVNPAGVYFGKSAVIDVGDLYAVGGSLSKEDFLAGLNRFTQLTGTVRNEGSLQAASVALVGRSVMNSGTIVSPHGFVALAAGEQILLGQKGSSIYVDTGASVAAAAPGHRPKEGVVNSGTVDAGTGSVALAAGDIYSVAITHSGLLRGRDVCVEGAGKGTVHVAGKIDATSTEGGKIGGRIAITGEQVNLLAGTYLEASGAGGGGTILVGGDAHGANPDLRNAQTTVVAKGATMVADATKQGSGGKVVVWADQKTHYDGAIRARGAGTSAQGGFAEVSGKHLVFKGTADLSAPGGSGTLLLDPFDLTISNEPDRNVGQESSSGGNEFFPNDSPSTLSWASIFSVLSSSNLTVTTSSEGGGQSGNLTIAASPLAGAYNTPHTLTLFAEGTGGIFVNAPVVNAGTGALQLWAGSGGITLRGTAGTTLLGTRGILEMRSSGPVAGSGILSADTRIEFNGGVLGTVSNPIATSTGSIKLNVPEAHIRNAHTGGLALTDLNEQAVIDVESRNTMGTADAPLNVTISPSVRLSSLRLWGSDLAVTGQLRFTSTLSLGNSGTVNLPASWEADTLILENSGSLGAPGFFGANVSNLVINKSGGSVNINDEEQGTVTVSGQSTNNTSVLLKIRGGAGTVTIGSSSWSAPTITIDGGAAGSGTISADRLIFAGGQHVGAAGAPLSIGTPSLVLGKSGPFDVFLSNSRDAGLTIEGFSGRGVSLLSQTSSGQGFAPVSVARAGFTAIGSLDLTTSSLTLSGNLGDLAHPTAATVTINHNGAISGGGTLIATQMLNLNGTGEIGSAASPLSINSPAITLNALSGAGVFLRNGNTETGLHFTTFTGSGSFSGKNLTLFSSSPINVGANRLSFQSTGNLNLNGLPITADTLTLAHDGALLGYTAPQVSTLVLGGAGDDGSSSQHFLISVPNLVLEKTRGARVFLDNTRDQGLTLSGVSDAQLLVSSWNSGHSASAGMAIAPDGLRNAASTTLTLSTLALNGGITSPTLSLTASEGITGAGILNASFALTLNGAGEVGTRINPIASRTPSLVVNKPTGGLFLDNGTAALALTSSAFTGGGAITSGDFTLNGSIDVGLSHDLALTSSGFIALGDNTIRANILSLTHDGILSGSSAGPSTTNQLVLGGGGDVGASSAFFTFAAARVSLVKTGGANVFLTNRRNLGVTVDGSTGGVIALRSLTADGAATAGLTVGSDHLRAAQSIDLESSTLRVNGEIDAQSVTLNHSSALAGPGLVRASTQLSLNGDGEVGSALTPLLTSTPVVALNKSEGRVFLDNGGLNLVLTPTRFTAGGAFSSGSITLGASVEVGENSLALTASTGSLNFGTYELRGGNLTLNHAGELNSSSLVSANQLTLRGTGDVVLSTTRTPLVILNKPAGSVRLDNGATDLAITATEFTGGGEFAGGNVRLTGPIDVGANKISFTSAGTLDLGSARITADTLSLIHDGALLNYAAPTISTLELGGAGDDGTADAHFVISATQLNLGKTGPAQVFIDNRRDAGLTVSGSVSSLVSIDSLSATGVGTAALTVGTEGLSSNGSLSLRAAELSVLGEISSPSLTLSHDGALTGPGVIRASNQLNLLGTGDVGALDQQISTATPAVVINKLSGTVYLDNGDVDLSVSSTALNGDAVFQAANLSLTSAMEAGSHSLRFLSAGAIDLGAHSITAGAITFAHGGALFGSGSVNASQLTFLGIGQVGASDAPLRTVTSSLTVDKPSGALFVDNETNALSFTPVALGGGGALRAGSLTILAPLDASGSDLSITSLGTLDLGSNAITAGRLRISNEGGILNPGLISAAILELGGSGDNGSAASRLVVSTSNLVLGKTGNASVVIDNHRDLGLTVSGTTHGTVAINSLNASGGAPADVTIGRGGLNTDGVFTTGSSSLLASDEGASRALARTALDRREVEVSGHPARDTNPSGSVTVNAAAITLDGNIDSATIALEHSGPMSGSGRLNAATQLTLVGTGDVGSTATAISSATPALVLNKTSGAVFIDNNGNALILTPTAFTGGGSFSTGNFVLDGSINVGTNDLRLSTTGTVTLGAFTLTAGSLSINNANALSGTGLVTAKTLNLSNEGAIGSVFAPLIFSGSPADLVLQRSPAGVNVGFFGNANLVETSTAFTQSVSSEARQTAAAQYDSQDDAGTTESDAPAARGTKKGGGAAFRAVSAKADVASAAREQLQALGIYARPLHPEERLARERKEAVFVTVPESERPKDSDFEVADARIDPAALQEVLRFAAESGLTEGGKNRLSAIAKSLAVTFNAFSAASSSAEPGGYRTWLEQHRDADATAVLGFVQSLRSTVRQIELLGLTHQEIEVSKAQIFGSILQNQLNADPDFLRALVEDPPSKTAATTRIHSADPGYVLR